MPRERRRAVFRHPVERLGEPCQLAADVLDEASPRVPEARAETFASELDGFLEP